MLKILPKLEEEDAVLDFMHDSIIRRKNAT